MRRHSNADILIVDDTLSNLEVLTTVLTDQGYQVRSATNGKKALQATQVQQPDLILLDIMMPEMNGYQLCEHLKANPQTAEIPIIFISSLYELVDKEKAFDVGGADYITKPFLIEELLVKIKYQLLMK
ncbi:MAG: response regulator [Symploca sp. SIO2G7]|nr:response regulator [Symploca sp. SIO2G7]